MTHDDLDTLPARFSLTIERKPDGRCLWWKITSPEHPGLLLVHRNLEQALEDAPRSLALLLRLNAAV